MADKKPTSKASAKAAEPKAEKKVEAAPVTTLENTTGKKATGLRVGAVILWLVAIGFEVLAVLILNGNWEKFQIFLGTIFSDMTAPLIIAIVADLVCIIVGSQLWKAANHKDPVSEKNKIKFVLWNNMGVIAAVVAFLPLIILLLKNKDLDAKTKKIVTVIAALALVLAAGTSIDYNPVSQEDFEAQAKTSGYVDGSDVIWTTFGKSYHLDRNCQSLRNSPDENINTGSLDQAFAANRTDPCDFCAGGGEAKNAA